MRVYEHYRINGSEGDVGIEIEAEGEGLPWDIRNNFWKDEEDGSLRGGREYVLKRPIRIDAVPAAMDGLNNIFQEYGTALKFTHRTSVHVHVNVSQMELSDAKKFVFLSYLFDNVLAQLGGREIKGNRFALRMCDAQGMYFILREFFLSNHIPNNNEAKYSSINICPINNYGSVEFRSMRGTNNKELITNWCKILINMREVSKEFPSMKDIYELAVSNPEQLIDKVFKEDCKAFFHYENIVQDVQANISLLAGLHTIRG